MTKGVKHNILFVGNPGAGKSTLLNCLIMSKDQSFPKKDLFRSGISFGEGMTYKFDKRQLGDVMFMDTPGLEDTKLREKAAEAISEALRQNGEYKIVFVVTLEAGRVRPQDVTVINLVLEAAPEINVYGLIFNKLTKGLVKGLETNTENKAKLIAQTASKPNKNNETRVPIPLFLRKIEDLDDRDNATVEIPELKEFLDVVPAIVIHDDKVGDIEIDKYQKYTEQLEAQLKELKESKEAMERRMERDKIEFETKLNKTIQEERERHDEKMRRIEEENRKNLESLRAREQAQVEELRNSREADRERHEERMKKIEEEGRKEREMMQMQFQQQQQQQLEIIRQSERQHEQRMEHLKKQNKSVCSIS